MEGNSIVSNDVLTSLADAINSKIGGTGQMTVQEMVTAVQSFSTIGPNGITSVSLPNATSIGEYAFYGCSSLTSVSLPNATSIGEYAFYGCSSLTSIELTLFTVDQVAENASSWGIPSQCVVTCNNGDTFTNNSEE